MWRRLIFILPLLLSVSTIRVPVDKEETPTDAPSTPEATQNTPVYYITDDENVDSYLIPPSPHKPEEAPEEIAGLPTFLIPPSKDRQSDYYVPKQSADVQSDWLPILQAQPLQNKRNAPTFQRVPLETIPIFFNPKQASAQVSLPPVPSTHLEPPSVDAVNEFFIDVPEEEVHVNENNEPIEPSSYNVAPQNENPNVPKQSLNPAEPTLALHLTPPKPQSFNAPTKLYPKKYAGGFQPVPIPLAQFADPTAQVPKAKPAKYFKPQSSAEVGQFAPDEKKLYHYQKAEHQRKLKGEEEGDKQLQSADGVSDETYGEPTSAEQETSETNLRYPGHNAYPIPPRHKPHAPVRYGPRPAPIRQAPEPTPPQDVGPAAPAPDGRTEFRMHGMKGPHSYQFGYDTGKGKNRQFRYEERDNDGLVKGHYGYVDRAGKLRVVNYSAHPEYGFRAEEPVEKQS
ncbi:fibrous sheath CABYR-binding protein-like [Helicoverpa zea]|uniref:fibrous sheath CABYR-binding protein-like n=1 Tax=Helicoverpa zea TaxID=7113 RepID=UPI001F57F791|nr:fibrous sheath CABYR-binding protein-like [Helicoverpa zea]